MDDRREGGSEQPMWDLLPDRLFLRVLPIIKTTWRLKRRAIDFDKRFGFFSAGLPLGCLMIATIAAGTFLLDKQFELRELRVKSIGYREQRLEEEYAEMNRFLSQTIPPESLHNEPIPRYDD